MNFPMSYLIKIHLARGGSNRVDVVFDVYLEKSIKNAERARERESAIARSSSSSFIYLKLVYISLAAIPSIQ